MRWMTSGSATRSRDPHVRAEAGVRILEHRLCASAEVLELAVRQRGDVHALEDDPSGRRAHETQGCATERGLAAARTPPPPPGSRRAPAIPRRPGTDRDGHRAQEPLSSQERDLDVRQLEERVRTVGGGGRGGSGGRQSGHDGDHQPAARVVAGRDLASAAVAPRIARTPRAAGREPTARSAARADRAASRAGRSASRHHAAARCSPATRACTDPGPPPARHRPVRPRGPVPRTRPRCGHRGRSRAPGRG